jgi:hypothetical protein
VYQLTSSYPVTRWVIKTNLKFQFLPDREQACLYYHIKLILVVKEIIAVIIVNNRQFTYKRNTEKRSRNYYYREKQEASHIVCVRARARAFVCVCVCVCVSFDIQYTRRMRRIILSVACPGLP